MKHALIFAAGKGERMRPLTEHTPKPLLPVGDKPLIVWHIEKLARAGVSDIVINTSYLAEKFPAALGDGSRWGARIHYAYEGETPLETGGGLLHALPLLGSEPFIAVSGDIWCDADFSSLPTAPQGLAHLLMTDNPVHHPEGDFRLDAQGRVHDDGEPRLTYSGIAVFRRELLDRWAEALGDAPGAEATPARFKLRPLLEKAIGLAQVNGSHHRGAWTDVGTPQRLDELEATLHNRR
ncbi:MAG: N-acetylmuramate alpha-1-phosphate uridylyltransferase MurU [Rhodanobacter sp.]